METLGHDPSKCPITGREIFPDVAMLSMTKVGRVACPACGRLHYWDPTKRIFIKAPNPP